MPEYIKRYNYSSLVVVIALVMYNIIKFNYNIIQVVITKIMAFNYNSLIIIINIIGLYLMLQKLSIEIRVKY
jgi:hypothetical protein